LQNQQQTYGVDVGDDDDILSNYMDKRNDVLVLLAPAHLDNRRIDAAIATMFEDQAAAAASEQHSPKLYGSQCANLMTQTCVTVHSSSSTDQSSSKLSWIENHSSPKRTRNIEINYWSTSFLNTSTRTFQNYSSKFATGHFVHGRVIHGRSQ
jgi:hypothetical protein